VIDGSQALCKIKVVKENYCAIVIALNNIYEEIHEPEALGISKALSKKSTISAMILLDYVLPQVAKLSKTLQTEKLNLTVISSLVKATLHSIDDALTPAANWVLPLRDLEETISVKSQWTTSRQCRNTFFSTLKANITSHFSSQDVVSAFSIFDPKKTPKLDSSEYSNLIQNSPAVKKVCSPKKAIVKKDVKSNVVADNSGEFVLPSPHFTRIWHQIYLNCCY